LLVIVFYYFLVFIASLLVDVIPLVGPPAWTVMVLCQASFNLDIWWVLILGVTGSAIGRYVYASYVHLLSQRFIKPQKNIDLQFIGSKLAGNGWRIHLFVLFYTLMPLPSTPLFTAAGIARIKTLHIIPAFFIGKFISDAAMVYTGHYVVNNIKTIGHGLLSFKSLAGITFGLILICLFLFIDWRKLLMEKKFRISFNIWK
jgi:membrane protein YqaA with SNARE-associated domain